MAGKQRYTNQQIIQALHETNGLISLAAKKLGCVHQTIYNRIAKVKSVKAVVDEARGELVDYAKLALRSALLDKEPWAVTFTLKTLGKDEGFTERQELTGAGGG